MNKIDYIFSVFEDYYEIDFKNHVKTRKDFFISKRQLLDFCLKKHTKLSFAGVGACYKYKLDHATMMHSYEIISGIHKDPTRRQLYNDLKFLENKISEFKPLLQLNKISYPEDKTTRLQTITNLQRLTDLLINDIEVCL